MVDYALIWAGLLAFIIITYVILDGFDLGVGILFPFVHHNQRDVMMNSIAPFWDGNETWLVMGGASLYGAFPLAYSTLLPVLYLPILIMLIALIFRGVAFEFRFKAEKARYIWDISFFTGSMVAAFAQGVILGTFVQGYDLQTLTLSSIYQWFTPFSVMSGIALVCGYALLGATWLIQKTEKKLQEKMFKIALILLPFILLFIGVASIWTPFINPVIFSRWFSLPNFYFLAPLPVLTAFLGFKTFIDLKNRHEKRPFFFIILIFLLCYAGFAVSAYPYLVPHVMTLWQAASDTSSLKFILVGAIILLPILLVYTVYSYIVFKGKISDETGYH